MLELQDKLERKEYLMQLKEQKWAQLEKVLVPYVRKDPELRQRLTEIKYLVDDSTVC